MKHPITVLLLMACLTSCQKTPNSHGRRDVSQRLIVACHRVDVAEVTRALRDGADVNSRFGDGDTKLFQDPWDLGWPCAGRAWTPLIALASSSMYPDPPRPVRNTVADLDWAREQKKQIPQEAMLKREQDALAILHILLSHGCNLNDHDGVGATALYSAVYGEHEKIAETLLAFGAEPNTKTGIYIDGTYNCTPLHRAWWSENLTRLLLKAGADPDAKDSAGHTPRQWCRDPKIVKLYEELQQPPERDK